jgi:hypothetical protein
MTGEVSTHFHLVERDIKRFMSQMSEAAALSVTPERQVHTIFGELLDRLGAWYRAWGLPVKMIDDPECVSNGAGSADGIKEID